MDGMGFVAKENMMPPPTQEHLHAEQHPRVCFSFLYAKLHLPKRPSRKLYLDLILADVEQGGPPNGLRIKGFPMVVITPLITIIGAELVGILQDLTYFQIPENTY